MKTIEALFSDWQAAEARASKPDATEAEVDEACDETRRLEEAMMFIPSQTARDLALKIGVLSGFGMEEICGQVFPGSEPFWAEIRALAGMPPIAAPSMPPEERAKLEGVIAALSKRELWALLVVLEGVQDGELSMGDALEGVWQAVKQNRATEA
jgi:hypothetical protein